MATPPTLQYLLSIIAILPDLILPYLNRADVINLQIVGVKLNLSRTVQTKYLGAECDVVLKPYCNTNEYGSEKTPEAPLFCPNGSMSQRTRIMNCAGLMEDPTRRELLWDYSDQCDQPPVYYQPHDGPFQVCQRCSDWNREEQWRSESIAIRSFRHVLCREHSEEHTHSQKREVCSCYAKLDGWRCNDCRSQSLNFLKWQAKRRQRSLCQGSASSDSRPSVSSAKKKMTRKSALSVCAIPTCRKLAWTAINKKAAKRAMVMCLVCCAIQSRDVPAVRLRGWKGL